MSSTKQLIRTFICSLFLGLSGIIPVSQAFSQPVDPTSSLNIQVEGRVHYGFFGMHLFEMQDFNSHFPGFEFIIQHNTFGKSKWEAVHNYPIIGLSAFYSPLGHVEEIGASYAALPFISFPLNKNPHRSINFRVGIGLAYLTNKFDRLENYKNIAINSNWNAAVNFTFDYRHQLNEFLYLTSSVGLMHFSSGTTPKRTFGLNLPTASVGLASFLGHPKPIKHYKLYPELFKFKYDGKRWFIIESVVFGGRYSKNQTGGNANFSVQSSVTALKPVSSKSNIGLGLDAHFVKKYKTSAENIDNIYQIKPGITAAYEMIMSKTSLVFHIGSYLTGFNATNGPFYSKLALKRFIQDDLFVSLGTSMYGGRIDFVGIGVGYSYYHKYY